MLYKGYLLQNRYHITGPLGQGGMGQVYYAEDNRLGGRLVAIKEFSTGQVAPAEQAWRLAAFQQEAEMVARLHYHGLADVFDFFTEGANAYVVMEYVQGERLDSLLNRSQDGRLPPQQAVDFTVQLCQVLAYLHGQQPPVVFRDLKPDNLMIQLNGRLKLIDFGIARFFKAGQSQDTQPLGTPGYASPEQYGRGQTDPRSDVYSLGVLLHQMLTGYDPSQSPLLLPPVMQLNPAVPPYLGAVVERATHHDPAQRFQNMAEFQAALLPGTARLGPTDPTRRPAVWIAALIGGVALLAVLSGLVLALRSVNRDTSSATAVASGVPAVGPPSATPMATQVADKIPTATFTLSPSPQPSETPEPSQTPTPTQTPTFTPTSNPFAPPASPVQGDTWLRPIDGMVLVYVPPGTFQMGSNTSDPAAQPWEFPRHSVTLSDGFWLDRTEVNNEQYGRCLADGTCGATACANEAAYNAPDQPAVCVTWFDAQDYCAWVGGQVPSEAQWEYAARGPDGRIYPWGNNTPDSTLLNYNNNVGRPAAVGSYPGGASWVGALDMAGNVWEWVYDWYDEGYYGNSSALNPTGPNNGEYRVFRGGGWPSNSALVRVATRFGSTPTDEDVGLGIRCILPASE
jgi:serine/threonine protein kinase